MIAGMYVKFGVLGKPQKVSDTFLVRIVVTGDVMLSAHTQHWLSDVALQQCKIKVGVSNSLVRFGGFSKPNHSKKLKLKPNQMKQTNLDHAGLETLNLKPGQAMGWFGFDLH